MLICQVGNSYTEVSSWNLKPDMFLQVCCKYTQVKETHCWNKSSGHAVESPSDEAFKSNPDILTKQLPSLQHCCRLYKERFLWFECKISDSVISVVPLAFWQAVLGNVDQAQIQLKSKRVRKSQFPVQLTQLWLLEDCLTVWCC